MHIGQIISALTFWNNDPSQDRFSTLCKALQFQPHALSEDGNTAVVTDPVNSQFYIFARCDKTWQLDKYVQFDSAFVPQLGKGVGIDRLGRRVVVASDFATHGGLRNVGSAFVYHRRGCGDKWRLEATFTEDGPPCNDIHYGRDVCISSDGKTIAVTSTPDPVWEQNPPKVFVYGLNVSNHWELTNTVIPTNGHTYQSLGFKVKLNHNGTAMQVSHLDKVNLSLKTNHFYFRFSSEVPGGSEFRESVIL